MDYLFFRRFFIRGLAHTSYMIGSQGECAVVDPRRDVDFYLKIAEKEGLKITHILETHLHADFISGHLELADITGAKIYISQKAQAEYDHIGLKENDRIEIGDVRINVLETPGHTPEHISLLVSDDSDKPELVFTGDTLFVGDVGRPDLFGEDKASELAGKLYDSLHNKLMRLEDHIQVYPAHGAVSLCSLKIEREKSSTIGHERRFNYAIQEKDRKKFTKLILEGMLEAPVYFSRSREINRKGPEILREFPGKRSISPQEAYDLLQDKAILLDIRSSREFSELHAEGAISIGFSPCLSTWSGWITPYDKPIILMIKDEGWLEPTVRRLIRVGHDDISGYVEGGIEAWQEAGLPTQTLTYISAQELKQKLDDKGEPVVLDVRTKAEWDAGHIPGAFHIPLGYIPERYSETNGNEELAVMCDVGYRSTIASSILQRNNFGDIYNIKGGINAWKKAGYETVM